MIGVEQAKLLTAMHGVERIIDIEHDAARRLAKTVTIVIDHGAAQAQQGAGIGQILGARDGRLRGDCPGFCVRKGNDGRGGSSPWPDAKRLR